MSVIARLTVPADQFPPGEVLEVRPGINVRLESMIPTGDAVVPYFWVPSGDADAVEAALADSPIVEEVHTVDEAASEVLFRVTWSDAVNGIMAAGERVEAIRRRTAAVLAGE